MRSGRLIPPRTSSWSWWMATGKRAFDRATKPEILTAIRWFHDRGQGRVHAGGGPRRSLLPRDEQRARRGRCECRHERPVFENGKAPCRAPGRRPRAGLYDPLRGRRREGQRRNRRGDGRRPALGVAVSSAVPRRAAISPSARRKGGLKAAADGLDTPRIEPASALSQKTPEISNVSPKTSRISRRSDYPAGGKP